MDALLAWKLSNMKATFCEGMNAEVVNVLVWQDDQVS